VDPVNISVRSEYCLHLLWNNFKHIGGREFFEIVKTSKEIMSFHDYSVAVFRFPGADNDSSCISALSGFLVDWGL
jgi:hypothetical protein